MKIRRARIEDVKTVHRLINSFAERQEMLPRSLNDLYENLRDLIVCEESDSIKGAVSLHVLWADLAEIRSLAVTKDSHRKGVGKRLVRKALREAKALGIKRVFALTYHPEYFIKSFGFAEADKSTLPQKIWGDCLKCHKFPECDETAVVKDFKEEE